jgi:hypothetical protein
MLEIIRYTSEQKSQWENLITGSRNGTFLFYRDYMDYHSDRYTDCSFLILRKGKVEAVIPGNISNSSFFSHQGLTFGGLVSSFKIRTAEVVEIFNLLNNELKNIGIKEIIYKPVPWIYHNLPAQEDIYALFLNKAEKIGCNIASTIFQNSKLPFSELRRRGIRKSLRGGIEISESHDFSAFWDILENNLSTQYRTKPVHSVQEIELLSSRFPDNIKLYVAKHNGIIVAGSVLYVLKNIVHTQYISANEFGKEIGALDALFDKLINNIYQLIPVFDFGGSTEQMGHYLNENLIFQKEGFGGRGIVYEVYKYNL